MSKLGPGLVLGPDEEDSRHGRGDEVVQPPPALDARPVHLENRLPDGQRAVVPHEQEY